MTDRTVLITGATGKLGQVIARDLVGKGWCVVLTSRDAARADALASELGGTEAGVHGLSLDLTAEGSIAKLLATLRDREIVVTHLVNNARLLDTLKVGEDGVTTEAAFAGELDIDVVKPYRLTMALAQEPDSRLINVVNIGSQYGEVAPNPALYGGSLRGNPIQYGVAKAALHHMTRELAVRLAPKVRVNCVAFGGFAGRAGPAFIERYAALCPDGRMLRNEEAAGPVAFLLGADSSSVNGHILIADLGWSIW